MVDSTPVQTSVRPGAPGQGHFLSQLLSDREQFFAEVADGMDLGGKIRHSLIIQVLVGSRLRLAQVLALTTGALALSAIVLAAIVPVALFFLLTGANYHFLSTQAGRP